MSTQSTKSPKIHTVDMCLEGSRRPRTTSLHPVAKRQRTCPAMVEEPGDNMVQFEKDYEEHSTWAFRKEMIKRLYKSIVMLKPTSRYPVAAAHLNNYLRASYVLGRDCGHATLRNMRSLGYPSLREREKSTPFCFTLSNDTTKSDKDPGKVEGRLGRGGGTC